MAIVVTKEEKILRDKRHKQFVYLLDKYKVRTRKLALLTGIEENNLSSYKSGKQPITEHTMERIMRGFEILDQELLSNKPNVEVEDWEYVKQQLARHDNVFVNKKKVKNIKNYLDDLKLNGFDCSYQEVDEGYIISHHQRMIKPMVEITKPKPVIESDPSIIDKVRNMHQDSLVMHEEALKLQAETDEIVKSVDEMEAKLTPATDEDHEKILPGWRDGLPAFKSKLDELFPDNNEQITITDEDIKEATQSNSRTYEMNDEAREFFKHLSEEEEEELKELAEETLANCGLEKGIHSVYLVEFLETRLNKLEVRGFLRGKAIESLLEEDYQTASMCIKYFTDKGYIEMGEGV